MMDHASWENQQNAHCGARGEMESPGTGFFQVRSGDVGFDVG